MQEIGWKNDQPLTLGDFNKEGLAVTFSERVHPASMSLDTFIVTLELAEQRSPPGHRPFIVPGTLDAQDAGQKWVFRPLPIKPEEFAFWLYEEQRIFKRNHIRCRVVLKGHAILDRAGKRALDGAAAGRVFSTVSGATGAGEGHIDLRLPSGNGVPGSEFQSWFYLTGQPVGSFAAVAQPLFPTPTGPSPQPSPPPPSGGTQPAPGPTTRRRPARPPSE